MLAILDSFCHLRKIILLNIVPLSCFAIVSLPSYLSFGYTDLAFSVLLISFWKNLGIQTARWQVSRHFAAPSKHINWAY